MKILFLCVANSARSQMAEGIAHEKFGNDVGILSAGSNPTIVNPLAVEVMQEINIDISNYASKSIDTIDLPSVDIIVMLCAEEICPVVLGNQQKYHWPLPDPSNQLLTRTEQIILFRKVRDELIKRIHELKIILNSEQ